MRLLSSLVLTFLLSNLALATTPSFPKIVDETALKESVDPCDDFYEFSCGTWMDQTQIPPEKKGISRQTTPMDDLVDVRLNQILDSYAKGHFQIPATYATKLADFYTSCMNADQNKAAALSLLKTKIIQIQKSRNADQLAALVADLHKNGVGVLFNFYSMQDYNDSSRVLGDISQGGMALGNPAYYLETDAKSVEVRQKYVAYITKLFVLIGARDAHAQRIAQRILQIETQLASKAYSVIDQSDPDKVNHVMGVEDLKNLMPHFNWDLYFQARGFTTGVLNVDEPEFFTNLDQVLSGLSHSDRDYYFIWLVMNNAADKMGGSFEQASFAFWNAYMKGTTAMLPRWKLCTQAAENSLGYALAEAYVKTFDGDAIKVKANDMIDNIKQIFIEDLGMLSTGVGAWIDGATASQAVAKAQTVSRKVGAPEVFRDYSSLTVVPDNYLANAMNITAFENHRDMAKIGQPVDKTEWGMMPWEVNAYYDRSNNEFVFPFGILQPPSLDLTASDGANYGAFGGGTIGHELTHGFDNEGSKYDSQGNLKNWWSPDTEAKFDQKAQCYVQQANAYKIASVGLNVNGQQTLEENLADQGGVKLGYMVLEKILSQRPEVPKWLGKYSERQQYWIAYAQSWCSKYTEQALRWQMINDPHPPAEFRVNAVMMNRPEFARDFQCKTGARMAPANRCDLW